MQLLHSFCTKEFPDFYTNNEREVMNTIGEERAAQEGWIDAEESERELGVVETDDYYSVNNLK